MCVVRVIVAVCVKTCHAQLVVVYWKRRLLLPYRHSPYQVLDSLVTALAAYCNGLAIGKISHAGDTQQSHAARKLTRYACIYLLIEVQCIHTCQLSPVSPVVYRDIAFMTVFALCKSMVSNLSDPVLVKEPLLFYFSRKH